MVSLSLFLFNLLLLPHTDGIHLFAALLSAKESPNMSIPFQLLEQMTDDDESQDGPTPGSRLWDQPRPEDPWQRRVRRIAQTVTASAVAAWAVGWVTVALLKSS
jgi:S2P endopeptidase